MLVRVRDEFRQQLTAYQGLYDSSIAYGMRHALVAETHKAYLNEREATLSKDCDELETKIADLENRIKDTIKLDHDEREEIQAEHNAFVNERRLYVKMELKEEIDTCLGNPNIIVNM